MLRRLRSRVWDKVYLWIFALLERTRVDKFVRKMQSLLAPEENLERQVKEFYGQILSTYIKLMVVLGVLGVLIGKREFWILLSLSFVIGIGAPFWDVRKKKEKRELQLKREYGFLLMKLNLYLGAGMSVRNAFEKIVEDLCKEEKERYLLTEMKLCLKWLKSGLMETESYYRFGQRCGLPEYLRLGGLLAQNVKKGNSELLALLDSEMTEAKEKQRHEIRRNGERASTKLLGPMMLLLAMVLLLIMIPAFGSL